MIADWKEREAEYHSEGLVSEATAIACQRVELEELVKTSGQRLPTIIDA
jgi:hypothetical protein